MLDKDLDYISADMVCETNDNTSYKQVIRNIKDSVFTHLFGKKKNLKRLYAGITNDYTDYEEDDFKIITLENVLVNGVYNDLGFLLKDKLIILAEAQSTFNESMPIRYLIYLANSYWRYISENRINIYGTKKIKLPEPKFYMIYTGVKDLKYKELRLSDLYEVKTDDIMLELRMKIISKGDAPKSIVDEYIRFCQIYDENRKDINSENIEVLRKTINYCIENDILKEYLTVERMEVEKIMMQLFTQKQAIDLMLQEEISDAENRGIAIGEKRGESRGIRLIAVNMKNQGFDIDIIVKTTGLSKDEVELL